MIYLRPISCQVPPHQSGNTVDHFIVIVFATPPPPPLLIGRPPGIDARAPGLCVGSLSAAAESDGGSLVLPSRPWHALCHRPTGTQTARRRTFAWAPALAAIAASEVFPGSQRLADCVGFQCRVDTPAVGYAAGAAAAGGERCEGKWTIWRRVPNKKVYRVQGCRWYKITFFSKKITVFFFC